MRGRVGMGAASWWEWTSNPLITYGPGGLPTFCTDWRKIFFRDSDICRNPPASIIAPPPAPPVVYGTGENWNVPANEAEAQRTVDAVIAAQNQATKDRIRQFFANVPEQMAIPAATDIGDKLKQLAEWDWWPLVIVGGAFAVAAVRSRR